MSEHGHREGSFRVIIEIEGRAFWVIMDIEQGGNSSKDNGAMRVCREANREAENGPRVSIALAPIAVTVRLSDTQILQLCALQRFELN